jgi:hypothetical protein
MAPQTRSGPVREKEEILNTGAFAFSVRDPHTLCPPPAHFQLCAL